MIGVIYEGYIRVVLGLCEGYRLLGFQDVLGVKGLGVWGFMF